MSISRILRCDGPGCDAHVQTDHAPPHLPASFIETRQGGDVTDYVNHFCGWDCCMKYAAKFGPPEVIEL